MRKLRLFAETWTSTLNNFASTLKRSWPHLKSILLCTSKLSRRSTKWTLPFSDSSRIRIMRTSYSIGSSRGCSTLIELRLITLEIAFTILTSEAFCPLWIPLTSQVERAKHLQSTWIRTLLILTINLCQRTNSLLLSTARIQPPARSSLLMRRRVYVKDSTRDHLRGKESLLPDHKNSNIVAETSNRLTTLISTWTISCSISRFITTLSWVPQMSQNKHQVLPEDLAQTRSI